MKKTRKYAKIEEYSKCYAEGQKAERGFSCEEWSYKAKEYAPGRGSRLSTSEELIVWYVWRIVKGFWTLDYIVNNSSSAGNYINAPNASKRVDKTGEKVCGGFKDGQGNTYKIVTSGSGFAIVGGCCMDYGDAYPVASVNYYEHRTRIREFGSGVVVLTK